MKPEILQATVDTATHGRSADDPQHSENIKIGKDSRRVERGS